MKLTTYNKLCIRWVFTLDDRYKIYAPGALGGSFQFSITSDIPLRTSCVVIDMTGPYKVLCYQHLFYKDLGLAYSQSSNTIPRVRDLR